MDGWMDGWMNGWMDGFRSDVAARLGRREAKKGATAGRRAARRTESGSPPTCERFPVPASAAPNPTPLGAPYLRPCALAPSLARFSEGGKPQSALHTLLLGAAAGTVAATVCYPLDTIRRRQQMPGAGARAGAGSAGMYAGSGDRPKARGPHLRPFWQPARALKSSLAGCFHRPPAGKNYASMADAIVTMAKTEGLGSFFKGWGANTIKVVPQNAIRFVSYEFLKATMGIKKSSTDT